MRFVAVAQALLALLLLSPTTHAQQATSGSVPQRDPQALALAERALTSLGGRASLEQIRDCMAEGEVQFVGSQQPPLRVVWKTAGEAFRYESSDGSNVAVFIHGPTGTAGIDNGQVRRYPKRLGAASVSPHLPGLALLRRLSNPEAAFGPPDAAAVKERPAVRTETDVALEHAPPGLGRQEWFFDSVTGLPLRVHFRSPDRNGSRHFVASGFDFSDFRILSGILVPFQITIHQEGQEIAQITVKTVAFNVGLSPAEFELPAGGAR